MWPKLLRSQGVEGESKRGTSERWKERAGSGEGEGKREKRAEREREKGRGKERAWRARVAEKDRKGGRGSGMGNSGNADFILEMPIILISGNNTIDLLSLTVALQV
ncbi:hypothetical protein MRB53_005820 [Persea americana]|uniref:Uncharacterized protein n=1 Tax=Persea americana TaxID=3435 RepID=A0ACC2MG12_PERAE|nr:hypothetical protein MRB53_005820 [Persea americana]